MSGKEPPQLSVVVVTYNPRRDIFAWALEGIEEQTFDKSSYEVVVVDNNSSPPLTAEELTKGRSLFVRIVREERQGNIFARFRGILEAKGELIVFVDDDNRINSDYLEKAWQIARENPKFGAFGGKLLPVLEEEVPEWRKVFLGYLGVRDYGDESITSNENCWGKWEPPTAGMVLRKDVALEFVKFIDTFPQTGLLGRKGEKSLLSCEDSLIARLGYTLGYYCSYQPALVLQHYMKKGRFKLGYLMRLMTGYGRSHVILESVLGQVLDKPSLLSSIMDLCRSLPRRITQYGWAGFIIWFWDLGYNLQLRQRDAT